MEKSGKDSNGRIEAVQGVMLRRKTFFIFCSDALDPAQLGWGLSSAIDQLKTSGPLKIDLSSGQVTHSLQIL